MLYVIHRQNHPDLHYRGGQEPIIHIQASLARTIEWADDNKMRWAFTDANASSSVARFYKNTSHLDVLRWDAINAKMWLGDSTHKQAEFLIEHRFPITLVESIGVYSEEYAKRIYPILRQHGADKLIRIVPDWYY